MANQFGQEETFRDHIATVDRAGKRIWLYPLKPFGTLYNWRTVTSIIQFAIFFSLPFLKVKGHPAVLFQIFERKLYFFGLIFRPQDSYLLALMTVGFFIFMLLFTSIFGRVWCGWLCPQTIFLEMMFRKIEYAIEGSASHQKKLNKAPWDFNKAWRKTLKQTIFLVISFLVSNFVLSYVIGMDRLLGMISEPIAANMTAFISVVSFALVFYGVFAWFREQACITVCPYGRLQSVLQDQNTLMVTYDYKRGEPRGKATAKQVDSSIGDCVDCRMCLNVCPTGIDIRNGIQMECVNCTACIDSCNDVMKKLGRPTGLIRYTSAAMVENKSGFKFTGRMFAYFIAFSIIFGINVWFFSQHTFLGVVASRVPGMLFQQIDDKHVANIYDIQIINNTFDAKTYQLKILEPKGEVQANASEYHLEGDSFASFQFMIVLPNEEIKNKNTPVTLGVFEQDKLVKKVPLTFLGPSIF